VKVLLDVTIKRITYVVGQLSFKKLDVDFLAAAFGFQVVDELHRLSVTFHTSSFCLTHISHLHARNTLKLCPEILKYFIT